ncbi:GNAT family N-acetyltransferase [Devosia algicola]|uniref:GNAT family N-acetyltransferase n=1 Tax=Devosia algicola TaxID=3026418 RepID=A0ABY7YR06_9HYPH|nr:GNAT family N-acetyltransferase [Devosia algicola]WDR03694.1 GNAT family N-acetyltransferase [Devosia algicola]
MQIRPATEADHASILSIVAPVLAAGTTYALPTNLTNSQVLDFWLAPTHTVYVAEESGEILGTYYLMANQQGNGSHVANCGYITASNAQGKGVARQMCQHSQLQAVERGFLAMQFNHVVSSNQRAIALWQRLGFDIVGTLPGAFCHPDLGYVDSVVMFKTF